MKRPTLALAILMIAGCITQPPAPPPSPEVGTETGQLVPESISDADESYFLEHQLMVPVDGISPSQLRDTFNEARDGGRTHRATDILAPRGTPVIAALDGSVARMSQNALGGITVYLIDSDRRYVYYYAHLDHYSDALTPGLKVSAGDVIGYVGTSGNAPPDTPHLHFQAMRITPGQHDWWNGTPIDVRLFMTRTGKARE